MRGETDTGNLPPELGQRNRAIGRLHVMIAKVAVGEIAILQIQRKKRHASTQP
jgi:hypothetical protein